MAGLTRRLAALPMNLAVFLPSRTGFQPARLSVGINPRLEGIPLCPAQQEHIRLLGAETHLAEISLPPAWQERSRPPAEVTLPGVERVSHRLRQEAPARQTAPFQSPASRRPVWQERHQPADMSAPSADRLHLGPVRQEHAGPAAPGKSGQISAHPRPARQERLRKEPQRRRRSIAEPGGSSKA